MASAAAVPSLSAQPPIAENIDAASANNLNGARGGRGGQRGAHKQQHDQRSGRGRGRGGGRDSARGHQKTHRQPQTDSAATQAPSSASVQKSYASGSLGNGTLPASSISTTANVTAGDVEAQADDSENEVCFICASPVIHNSLAPCNHRTCHICALRLRALYKTRACAHCRTEAKFVIFTDNPTKRYEDFVETDFQESDEVLGIKYEQKEIHDDTVLLLRYNCPADDCDIACWGWPDLHRHVKGVHHKVLCDLCTRNKKVFTHEHELFTQQELRKHEKFGDDNPGAIDQSGFKGHPQCGFCVQRFYGEDELYTHCRDKHERCHICDRRNQGRNQQYYLDYNALEEHFRADHFLCADRECMEKKFVVFESEMDLKAHQLETHPNGLSKDARRDARRVDISGFDYREPHQQEGRGGRRRDNEGRGRGRGRDPNTEALPASTAQTMRRDELAYQRQMAIQSAQSVTTRTFGGQLTSTDAYAARPTGRNHDTVSGPRQPTNPANPIPSINDLDINSSATTVDAALTPQEQARQVQHTAVMNRASTLLRNDQGSISAFRTAVSSYRTSTLTAPKLIDTFFSLFDVPSADLGKLIKELADIYENASKHDALLKAWNDWRAINEDYPSLPGPSGVPPGSGAAAAGSGGTRVLRLKSSTAKSSRSAVSKQASWSSNAAGSSNPFPAIPTRGQGASSSRGTGNPYAPAWLPASSSSASSSSRPPQSTAAPTKSSRSQASSTNEASGGADMFPALPAARKPNTMMMGLTRGTVRWDDGRSSNGTQLNPWGAGGGSAGGGGGSSSGAGSGTSTPGPSGTDVDGEVDGVGAGKKKGGKKGKQTLYKFG